MLIIGIIVFLIVLGILIVFAFPQLSPIPYFPSNANDISMNIKLLNLKNNQVIIDLGAGDGIVIFKAAKEAFDQKLNTEFIAIETNPVLVAVLLLKKLFHANRDHIHIVMKDLFRAHYSSLISRTVHSTEYLPTFYLYISPWLIKQAIQQVQRTVKRFEVVSYFYPVPFLKEIAREKGKNTVYYYKHDHT